MFPVSQVFADGILASRYGTALWIDAFESALEVSVHVPHATSLVRKDRLAVLVETVPFGPWSRVEAEVVARLCRGAVR